MRQKFYSLRGFQPKRSLGYLIKRIAKLSSAEIERRFAGRELTLTHWSALTMLQHGLVDNCAGLSRQLGHNSGATTRLIDQLEARCLVKRQREHDDRRIVSLVVTEAGRQQLQGMTPILLGVWNEALESFARAEVETLIGLLSRLLGELEAKETTVEATSA